MGLEKCIYICIVFSFCDKNIIRLKVGEIWKAKDVS
jgi:hypothetical protein